MKYILVAILVIAFLGMAVSANNCFWHSCHAHSIGSWCPNGNYVKIGFFNYGKYVFFLISNRYANM